MALFVLTQGKLSDKRYAKEVAMKKILVSIVIFSMSQAVMADTTVFLSCEAQCGRVENIYMFSGEEIDNNKASIESRMASMQVELENPVRPVLVAVSSSTLFLCKPGLSSEGLL